MNDLVFMLQAMGVETDVDLDKLIEVSRWFEELLQHRLSAMVPKAGLCCKSLPPLG
jgi:isopropylmalate/homocitrate/citramalate synthase